jgi:hypothetical protein
MFAYLDFYSCVKSLSHHGTVLNLPSRLHSSQQVPNQPPRRGHYFRPYILSNLFNARTHVRKDRDPELFAVLDDNVHSQIAPPKSRIENALKLKYRNESIGFAEDREVSWLCAMLRLSYPEASAIILVPVTETSLFFCQQVDASVDCQMFWVASLRSRTFLGNFCGACQSAQIHATRQQKRREIDRGNRTSISSKVNIGYLSPESIRERFKNSKNDRNKLRRNIVQLEANRIVDDANKEFTDDAATLILFRKTLTHLSNGPMRDKLRRELIGCLIKEFGGEDMESSVVDNNEHNEFVDVVLTEIDNYTKKLNGKTTQLRLHPLIMRLATNLYTTSPSAYMDLQTSTLFSLPSESTMKKKKVRIQ